MLTITILLHIIPPELIYLLTESWYHLANISPALQPSFYFLLLWINLFKITHEMRLHRSYLSRLTYFTSCNTLKLHPCYSKLSLLRWGWVWTRDMLSAILRISLLLPFFSSPFCSAQFFLQLILFLHILCLMRHHGRGRRCSDLESNNNNMKSSF